MGESDWKRPFHQLGQDLRSLLAEDGVLYHANLMTPFHEAGKAESVVESLEPALMGHELVHIIETPTNGGKYHAHYFFGAREQIDRLGKLLSPLDSWFKKIPAGLLPEYNLPSSMAPEDRKLVLWANTLYYLAWNFDAWYLDADVEYQEKIDVLPFKRWTELPKPADADPRPILTHANESQGTFTSWPSKFQREACRLPEVIDAYLIDVGNEVCGEFLKASTAATDIIVGILDTHAGIKSGRGVVPRRTRTRHKRADRIWTEKFLIEALLLSHHDPKANPTRCMTVLTQEEIATRLGWISRATGKPLQKRVFDRMLEIFPQGGHRFYRQCFTDEQSLKVLIKDMRDRQFSKSNIQLSDDDE
ncbi:hypothetical protein [Rubinisphaera sp. JC750]|uniref:hypothetical protein n=1 Tax=Rubinisphaera sp. JC750 TaxID=2898658 RepID=UPI001F26D7D9|nr:hypothetical protein [Rubinisphaera sp. JC750]